MKYKNNLSVEEAQKIQRNFRAITVTALLIVVLGVIMMMYLESLAFIDALYFSVVSLTTVGYGDFTPVTVGGKLFVMVYLLLGIGIIAALLNNILKNVVARRRLHDEEEKRQLEASSEKSNVKTGK